MVEKGGRKANLESGLLASMCVVEVETVPLAWNRRGRRSSRRRSRSVLTVIGGRSVYLLASQEAHTLFDFLRRKWSLHGSLPLLLMIESYPC